MTLYQLLLAVHIAAGVISLIGYWAAGLARKGSSLHKTVGRVYLAAMLGVVATSLPMAAYHLAVGRVGIGVFLAYLVVITATSMWLSWRAVQLKRDAAAFYSRSHVAVGALNVLAGLIVFGVGLAFGQALLMGFCWVGVILGVGMLRAARAARTTAPTGNWWLREHYGAMLGNGVATHIAFLGIGMRPLLQALDSPIAMLLPWFLPLAVAGVAGVLLDRRYGAKREASRAARPAAVTLPG
ncbi:MAG: hypothetical protein MUE46_09285 [Xanthomonadales bacterium]|jgi:hypothetical protein|nr:hypothetical protein [Xanthomonadales bacterium]